MRPLMAFESLLSAGILRRTALGVGLGVCWISSGVLAYDIVFSDQTFRCLQDWPKVRNTYIYNADQEKLKEAMRIFRDSVPDTEYPVGTIFQIIPFEAMVKHPRGTFAKANDWEFFTVDVSAAGTKITDRGEDVLEIFDMVATAAGAGMTDHPRGVTCLSCHQGAAKHDLICEKTHGCAPIPLD